MTKHLLIALVFLALGASGTAGQGVAVKYDKETDFGRYKTYKWVPVESGQKLDELTSEQLVGTFEVQLAKKGLTKSTTDKADLFIAYQIAKEGDKHLNQSSLGASYGAPAGGASGTGGIATTTVHTGQLVLDMYDAEKKQLIWRGVVEDAIDANAKPDKKQKHMDKGVEKLLKDFPPNKK
jgi:hypothetical protein